MIKKIICLFLGHKDAPHEIKNLYIGLGQYHDLVYSWRCSRCKRIREYDR